MGIALRSKGWRRSFVTQTNNDSSVKIASMIHFWRMLTCTSERTSSLNMEIHSISNERSASKTKYGVVFTELKQLKPLTKMALSTGAKRMFACPNAGGSSEKSEILSFELLQRCFGADLGKTEMEVKYFPEGGSITDYTCKMFSTSLGVSVTRAMKFHGEFTVEDAERLLSKKLNGVLMSSKNTMEKWSKQILHIWVTSFVESMLIAEAYNQLPKSLKSNTVVLVTATEYKEVFTN